MEKKMKLELWLTNNRSGGGKIEVDIIFTGNTKTEILKKIQETENEIHYYMTTGDAKNESCFIFGDFILRKEGIQAIRLSEADF